MLAQTIQMNYMEQLKRRTQVLVSVPEQSSWDTYLEYFMVTGQLHEPGLVFSYISLQAISYLFVCSTTAQESGFAHVWATTNKLCCEGFPSTGRC